MYVFKFIHLQANSGCYDCYHCKIIFGNRFLGPFLFPSSNNLYAPAVIMKYDLSIDVPEPSDQEQKTYLRVCQTCDSLLQKIHKSSRIYDIAQKKRKLLKKLSGKTYVGKLFYGLLQSEAPSLEDNGDEVDSDMDETGEEDGDGGVLNEDGLQEVCEI